MHRRRNSSWKLHCVRLMPNLRTETWEHCILENGSKSFFENFPKKKPSHCFFWVFVAQLEYWQNLWCFETTHKATLIILRSSVVINMVSNPNGYVNARKAFKTYNQRVKIQPCRYMLDIILHPPRSLLLQKDGGVCPLSTNTFQGFRWQVTFWKQIIFRFRIQTPKMIDFKKEVQPTVISCNFVFGIYGASYFHITGAKV